LRLQLNSLSNIIHIDSGDRFSWLRDDEFARQTLAGLNPYSIQLVEVSYILI